MMFKTILKNSALILIITPTIANAEPLTPPLFSKDGSYYLQCDGNPNNMSAGESIVRLIAISAVVGLLAPSPESPDPSKRKFGIEGVAACDAILSGANSEGNAARRIPLILAKAIHKIEAKDYAGALFDVTAARSEANNASLAGNIYFDRSVGLSIDMLEVQALLRLNKVMEAREVNVRGWQDAPFSYYALIAKRRLKDYSELPVTPQEEATIRNYAKLNVSGTEELAAALDQAGRFKESADAIRSLYDYESTVWHDYDNNESYGALLLGTGLSINYAFANDWTNAELFYTRNQKIISELRVSGKEFKGESVILERMDFYSIFKLAQNGSLTEARRQFASRSRWTAPTIGQVMEMSRRLRVGAKSEELFGSLSQSPEELLEERKRESLAQLLQRDQNNRTLFTYILPYATAADYGRLANRVWNTKHNKIIAKDKIPKSEVYNLSVLDAGPLTQPDILLLHAALQAKARGFSGMVFRQTLNPQWATVYFTNRGAPGISDDLYLDADTVIADLRKVIPSPTDKKELENGKKANASR